MVWPPSGFPPEGLARHLAMRAPLLGFPAVRRMRSEGVYSSQRSHPPGYVPRSGFLTRCAASSSFGLAGLFHPATPFGFTLQGVSLSRSRADSSSTPVPSCRCSAVALPPPRMAGPTAHQPTTSRKWGRCLWPTSRLCSPRESVPTKGGFSTLHRPSPSWVFPLQGLPLPRRCVGSSPTLLPCA